MPRQVTPACNNCRIRHLRCNNDTAICDNCRELGLRCERQRIVRFRHLSRIDGIAFDYSRDQPWICTTGTEHEFHDETKAVREHYHGEDSRQSQTDSVRGSTPRFTIDESPTASTISSSLHETQHAAASPPGDTPPATKREVDLLRHFAAEMAKWADITDSARHFEYEVPRRAMSEPILRYAVCTFASRHLHRRSGESSEMESIDFQGKCLELLRPAVSEAQRKVDDVVLTAVAVLRQCEELNEVDELLHLNGATNLLRILSRQARAGGLGEAAAWLCLREDIYVALTKRLPLRTDIATFVHSSTITQGGDAGYACRAVLLLGRLLSFIYNDEGAASRQRDRSIADFRADLELWNERKPEGFFPLWHVSSPGSSSVVGDHHDGVSDLWMAAPHHALGLQYYHIARLVLASCDTGPGDDDDDVAAALSISAELHVVLSLAVSNPGAENLWFTARHCLSVWGGSLQSHADRQAAVVFLAAMEEKTGWQTHQLIADLKSQWYLEDNV